MAKVFISHSSMDKPVALNLYKDLQAANHDPWLDQPKIKVGQDIPVEIQTGLAECDFVVVLLSTNAVQSKWVEKEWMAKYWDEVNQGRIQVLPALLEDCDRPKLLKTKKYADFRTSYAVGFSDLVAAMTPMATKAIDPREMKPAVGQSPKTVELLGRAHDETLPMSKVIAECMAFGLESDDGELMEWCKNEVRGFLERQDSTPQYRLANVFSTLGQLNPSSWQWDGKVSRMLSYMQENPDIFVPQKLIVPTPISSIEQTARKYDANALVCITTDYVDKDGKSQPGVKLTMYGRPDTYELILAGIRRHLIEMLTDRLPSVSA